MAPGLYFHAALLPVTPSPPAQNSLASHTRICLDHTEYGPDVGTRQCPRLPQLRDPSHFVRKACPVHWACILSVGQVAGRHAHRTLHMVSKQEQRCVDTSPLTSCMLHPFVRDVPLRAPPLMWLVMSQFLDGAAGWYCGPRPAARTPVPPIRSAQCIWFPHKGMRFCACGASAWLLPFAPPAAPWGISMDVSCPLSPSSRPSNRTRLHIGFSQIQCVRAGGTVTLLSHMPHL